MTATAQPVTTKQEHHAEVERYERLATEAQFAPASANTPDYYRKRAGEHRRSADKL